jgi:hypothetical protein
MAKHGNRLPLRRQREGVEDALLIRSAESLGRMIGSLQRQLDGASKKLAETGALRMFGNDGHGAGQVRRDGAKAADTSSRKTSGAAARAKGGSKSGATKVRSTADRKSKRTSKSAAAKKTAGRARSGASREGSKGGRGAR